MDKFKIKNWHDLSAVEKMKECTNTFCAEEMIIGTSLCIHMEKDTRTIPKIDFFSIYDGEIENMLDSIYREYFIEDDKCTSLDLYGKLCNINGKEKLYFTDVMYIYGGETYWLSPKLKINFIERNKAFNYFIEPFAIDDFDTIYHLNMDNILSECDDEPIHGIIIKPYDVTLIEEEKPLYIEKKRLG